MNTSNLLVYFVMVGLCLTQCPPFNKDDQIQSGKTDDIQGMLA